MFCNAQKFYNVSFNHDPTGNKCNVYVNPKIILFLKCSRSQDYNGTFNVHINSLSKRKNLTGWICRTFIFRDKLAMLTLFKALVFKVGL